MTKLIERNTTIPTRKSEVFSTADDGQTSVHVKVHQGEREIAAANKLLGDFQLSGIPPAPRGIPQIEVTFDIDANGIVNVSAKDRATNKEQSITITGSSNLNKDDIQRMVNEAASHADEDRKARETAEARNEADKLIYDTERSLKELGDKVPSDVKLEVENAVAAVRSTMETGDPDTLKSKNEELRQASYKLAEILYRSTGGGDAGEQTGPEGSYSPDGEGEAAETTAEQEDVIDAEFKPS
jgi:molecular chaperone DnaK